MAQNQGVKNAKPAPYVAVLADIFQIQADLRRLETHVLELMHDAGIGDDEIGEVMGISSQAAGVIRRRKNFNPPRRKTPPRA